VIVVDASAVLELLLNTPAGRAVGERLLDPGESLHAPHLLDVEVLQVLRRYRRSGAFDDRRGREAIGDLMDLPLTRYPHQMFVERAWELRDSLTAYDAIYVALAEGLAAPLVTRDRRLAASRGHRARVELV